MYTIGQVAAMFQLPISTLRYYDKEGLFPYLKRKAGIRWFSEQELEALRVIDTIVTCYTDAMVVHHEATKFPPVRGMAPTPDPLASPFADLEDDLPWEDGKGGKS